MPKAVFRKYQLLFNVPVLTSRGEMKTKNGYYLLISENHKTGVGECSYIEGLSRDNLNEYEHALEQLCHYIETPEPSHKPDLTSFPSIQFGWECAMLDLHNSGKKLLFESEFTKGNQQIPINGLVWMGSKDFMLEQIERKLRDGFKCIKIKVGAIAFDEEVMLLKFIRNKFPADIIEIRLDANGAFSASNVFHKLDILSAFDIHSIEQPVKPGQHELIRNICTDSPIPVVLDEELIIYDNSISKKDFLQYIRPAYIILKPSLIGGLRVSEEWIQSASQNSIGWWATSALESNIGLNAIAQWVFTKNNNMIQGLGTGGLYTNNICSPLYISNGYLGYNPTLEWEKSPLIDMH